MFATMCFVAAIMWARAMHTIAREQPLHRMPQDFLEWKLMKWGVQNWDRLAEGGLCFSLVAMSFWIFVVQLYYTSSGWFYVAAVLVSLKSLIFIVGVGALVTVTSGRTRRLLLLLLLLLLPLPLLLPLLLLFLSSNSSSAPLIL
jgi:hypothetical protein